MEARAVTVDMLAEIDKKVVDTLALPPTFPTKLGRFLTNCTSGFLPILRFVFAEAKLAPVRDMIVLV